MIYSPLLVDIQSPDLSDAETALARGLGTRLMMERALLSTLDLYYDGEQKIANLGISVPPVMEKLHTVTGWPRLIVDALDERLSVDGFRYSSSPTADDELWDIWQANNLDEESPLAHLDALIFGRAFIMVGSGGPNGLPLVTVESPVNMAAHWDVGTRRVSSALQVFVMDGQEAAAIYQPNLTIQLRRTNAESPWEVADRDEHNLGQTPVAMLGNRQRSNDRYGRSEITPEVRSITDACCRTLLGMEAAREFYSVPQRYALGVTEEAFKDSNGNTKTAWESVMSKVWALPPDPDGGQVSVGTFQPMNPAIFTSIVDMYAEVLCSITGLPSHYFGKSTANPASADAIRSAEARFVKRAWRKARAFSGAWEQAMCLALMIQNNGELPADAHRIETIWADPATPTPSMTTAAIAQQITVGAIPPQSDVTLEKLGYSPIERERLMADANRSAGEIFLAQIAHSLQAKEARVDNSLAADLKTPGAKPAPTPAPPAPTPAPSGSGGN